MRQTGFPLPAVHDGVNLDHGLIGKHIDSLLYPSLHRMTLLFELSFSPLSHRLYMAMAVHNNINEQNRGLISLFKVNMINACSPVPSV